MDNQNQVGCCHGGRAWVNALIVLVIGAVVVVALLRDRIVNPMYRQVTVNGQGKIEYIPDIAIVSLGVQVDKVPQAATALSQLNATVDKVVTAVKKLGIEEKDIATANYSLSPQYDYVDNVSKLAGYSANQQINVKVREFNTKKDLLNQVIAAANQAGANQVNGVSFDVANLEELKQQARIKALQDAQTKAGDLANAVNVALGRINGWYENFYQPAAYYGDMGKGLGGGGEAAPVINPSQQELVVEIGLTYQLKDK